MKRATVRTYRHGLGDCHLVTLYNEHGQQFHILIDCGVILGTADAAKKMNDVMRDVAMRTDGVVDLLVATHEHWDHVSGFIQAAPVFETLTIRQVWMAWTEDPNDQEARQLAAAKSNALSMLHTATAHFQRFAAAENPLFVSLTEFFGVSGRTTADALEAVRALGGKASLRYCDPSDKPEELPDFDARIYVLGPPRDLKLLKTVDPSKKHGEDSYETAMALFTDAVRPGVNGTSDDSPFAQLDGISLAEAAHDAFFQRHYFHDDGWRRIDTEWMAGADELALALDNMTNNTSLVLAIELEGQDVLLFAADAQVGNWMSWGSRIWTVSGKSVTGSDLLERTILYKVGHHGSVNATLKEKGLALMKNLRFAIIPVDHDMAVKKRWGALPLLTLVEALEKATKSRGWVLRTDQELPLGTDANRVRLEELYVEVVC